MQRSDLWEAELTDVAAVIAGNRAVVYCRGTGVADLTTLIAREAYVVITLYCLIL